MRAMELCAPQWTVVSVPTNGLGLRKRLTPPHFVDVTNLDQMKNWAQRASEQAGSGRILEVCQVGRRMGDGTQARFKGGVKVG